MHRLVCCVGCCARCCLASWVSRLPQGIPLYPGRGKGSIRCVSGCPHLIPMRVVSTTLKSRMPCNQGCLNCHLADCGIAAAPAATTQSVCLELSCILNALQVQEVLITLPPMRSIQNLHISSSMRVVLRNSKTLARAKSPGVLAHSILLEEPLPQGRPSAAAAMAAAGADGSNKRSRDQTDRSRDTYTGRDQNPTPPDAAAAATAQQSQQQQQYVRASAHVVISALRDLWPMMEVWQYPMKAPGLNSWQQVFPELLCQVRCRDDMQQRLWKTLMAVAAEGGEEQEQDLQPLQQQRSGSFAGLWR